MIWIPHCRFIISGFPDIRVCLREMPEYRFGSGGIRAGQGGGYLRKRMRYRSRGAQDVAGERGAAVIEAVLCLTIFITAIFFILSFINL